MSHKLVVFATLLVLLPILRVNGELTPPYFNLAEGRKITASATCGVDTDGPELYCKLVGANTEHENPLLKYEVIQGQVCDQCDPSDPDKSHPPEYAIDGTENWWQSPPLSRGMKYNEVNLTIDFGQEFHVAYLYIRMGNSPRPGLWTLEKSSDYGKTWHAWQHFSDSYADCETFFGRDSLKPIQHDNDVICTTEYSKIVPLEGGEIPIRLLNNRPSAGNYFNSITLQEWTRATNVRLRLLRTKNLLGHLMSVARQDPTVTRRYFYSIKDISIGGRCVCNGHASTCGLLDPRSPKKILACQCQHNTCGIQCSECCEGFVQKKWRQNTKENPFQCEPCNCHGHTDKCVYSEEVDEQSLSLDIHGNYEGGGVCKECQDNTEGINCNKCKSTFYRPYGKHWNETDVCHHCNCNYHYSTGNCQEETGRCECREEFQEPNCDACSYGHFGYPDCRPCECNLNGTIGYHCEAINGECPCKINFGGSHCRECAPGYYNFPECEPCDCNSIGSEGNSCHESSGQCQCQPNYSGQHCDQCKNGYYDYPRCTYCHCDSRGTYDEVCNKSNGKCLCREGYGGPRCDQCLPGFYNYPDCVPCNCSSAGSSSTVCDVIGKCTCLENFAGRQCTSCLAGFYNYPECLPCNCDTYGSIGVSCNQEGQCQCKYNFDGVTCNQCKEGFYNFPACEECNCDPAGVIAKFAGCGSVPAGELCQCKERVQGRICDKCRPLYWNLNASNPHGCEDCNCFVDGTVGALDTCDTKSGQCACKPSVTGRTCNVCRDGTFDLYGSNLFGCKDCECDIGGAMNNVCDKTDGNCRCHPRIAGRACDYPLTMHYFPTLYQFQFEYEDGYTSSGAQVRYQFHEDVFPEFSKRGYAVMSELQSEVINEVVILKSSVYRVVIRYKNPNQDNVVANILIQSDNPSEVDQYAKVLFKSTFVPEFVTVSGAKGEIPSPVVLDPGRYTISIKTNKTIFLDYFVLLPAAYYEASILTRKIVNPCEIGDTTLCRHFKYPSIDQYDPIYEAFIENGEDRIKYEDFFPDKEHLNLIGEHNLPFITNSNTKLSYDLDVPHSGRYVIVIDYITYRNSSDSEGEALLLQVNQEGDYEQDGVVTIYPCTYTTVCRQPVVDKESREKVFFVDRNDLKPINLVLDQPGDIAIKSIAAIPYEDWTIDYINPNSVCVMQNGVCVQTAYRVAPESKKIEFEHDNEDRIADKKPKNMYDETTKLVYLDKGSDNLNVKSKIPHSGRYSIIIKFYQPEHPAFNINYRIESDQQNYDGKIMLKHCPSNSGCRGLLIQENGIPYFDLDENVDFTLANGHDSRVWFDYVLFVPFDQFSNDLMEEETFDQTKEFIRQCGQDHFHIHLNASDFCKKSVFSLTADYNSGALPCSCDYHGSTSFECESFGGQCQCKPHIIGRQCEACKTGYYGFPDCKPCDCPSTALCHKDTGECICPERVTGEKCDKCMPFTFGFDQIIGCEECNCNPLGVEDNNLQCDLHTGTCDCRSNVVGRACDKCQYGFYNFPDCEPCRCDIRGTTYEICDQEDETCFCKKNTQGKQCNECADGTYNLKDSNPDGCTKCFCFGHTTRCDSAYLRPFNVSMMKDVSLNTINVTNGKMFITPWSVQDDILINETMAIVELSAVDNDELLAGNVYFGMLDFLLNQNSHITAYGGHLSYKIDYSTGFYGEAILAADVILHGKNMNIMHSSTEQPAAGNTFNGHVTIVESNFQTLSGMPVTREQFMIVLRDLQAIFIRANYWNHGVITMISDVSLTLADEDRDHYDLYEELDVERCECPAGYTGYSCEDCAPGYYRDPNGPYGGYCVPCQCNGHADTCDCNTGICENCQHFTTGDHCDQCIEGYYGNATYGTLDDCRICACPLPIESNNFATACEVTEDGYEIHCTCKEGYTGEKCQACAPGFYGDPETEGEVCKPCDCSGNINPIEFGSCDSRSGECLKCLNNTFGTACNLCAPGYYGDAILLKDCKNCVCDPIGTEHCDSFIGTCNCYPNVIGEKCDRCEDDHFGFESGQGCTACECGAASNSTQCEDTTGKCACKPGVTGRQCDRCIQGYWNYGPEGCVPCSCNTDYSRGLGCNAVTGQCECLSGVVGEKCDSCPYRWVLIPDEGCFECDGCHHALLDSTDALKAEIEPILADMKNIAEDYYTSQKLKYFDDLADELEPKVRKLDPNHVNLSPIKHEIEALEMDLKNMDRKLSFAEQNAKDMHTSGDKLLREASDILDNCRLVNKNMKNSVDEVEKLAHNIGKEAETKTEHALTEAVLLFDNIKKYSVTPESLNEQIANATSLLGDMENFLEPVKEQEVRLNEFKFAIGKFDVKLEDLYNWSNDILGKGIDINLMNVKNKGSLNKKFDMVTAQVNEATQNIEDSKKHLDEADNFISDYNSNAAELKKINNTLGLLNDQVEMQLQINDLQMKDIHQNVGMVQNFANDLQMMSNMLSTHYSNVQEITEEPLKAATAYSKIFEEVGAAGDQIQTTIQLAEDANKLTEGIQDRAGMSDQESRELLDEAMKLLNRIQTDLEPRIEKTSATVSKIKTTNDASDDQLNAINDGLQSIPNESYTDTWETAKDKAEDAIEKCKAAKNTMHPIVEQLKYDTQKARQLPQDIDTTNKDILQTSAQIDKFKNLIPNINKMVDSIGEKRDKVDSVLSDLGDRIGGLRKQLEHARDVANAIKVGLTFYPNTSLELKPPESMNQLGASSRVSTYFKTSNPDGLLVYLGNEYNEDKLGKNDFMALEIENGYPVLSVDLGNGPERVINEKYVADDKWYQAIVDRVDNKVKLTIREQGDDNKDMFYEKEANLTGVFSTFDVDNKNSHLFVGSYPVDYKMQSDVKANSYEGQIEELRIGDEQVGLWNFLDAENNYIGADERDRLITHQRSSTGYRFSGNGYVVLDARSYPFKKRSSIEFNFKANRDTSNGLLFYAGKNHHFVSVEMRDGAIVFQFKLGEHAQVVTIGSEGVFNDDRWHHVIAERDRNRGQLSVDGKKLFNEESIATPSSAIEQAEIMYFGGFPSKIQHSDVTTAHFDGCIINVTISGTHVDLSKNLKAFDVKPGCPDKVSSVLSFEPNKFGYLRQPNVSTLNNNLRVNLKFRTKQHKGVIFYATTHNQANTFGLTLEDGILVLRSNKEELTSENSRYDDGEWHSVVATHEPDRLTLTIDDIDYFTSTSSPPPLNIQTGEIYIGGLPKNFVTPRGAISNAAYFTGCISDVSVNSQLSNFAEITDKTNAILDQCSEDLMSYDVVDIPLHYPDGTSEVISKRPVSDIENEIEEEKLDKKKQDRIEKPVDIDVRNEFDEEKTEEPITITTTTTTTTTTEATTTTTTTEATTTTTTELPTTTTTKRPRVTEKPEPICKLPIIPDQEMSFDEGYRFGTGQESRIEFNTAMKMKKQYEFSMQFKTSKPEGLLFYVDDNRHTDYIAIYLKDGKVYHLFNCGSGNANMSSNERYDDGEWHTIQFTRQNNKGRLIVDDMDETEAESMGNTRNMIVQSPLYIGGIMPEHIEDVAINLKFNKDRWEEESFVGCIRNIKKDNADIGQPANIVKVIPCSSDVEPGVYFGKDAGFIKLRDKFKVGNDLTISMDIKPRSLTGMLLSVHGKKAFFILQMINGTIHLSVDNGDGPYSAKYVPDSNENFCDGQWRTITVIKSKYVITIKVNDITSEPAIGEASNSSTDTSRPLFLGGHPHILKIRGLTARKPFQGCIKNVKIRDTLEEITPKMTVGNVLTGVCPSS